MSFSNDALKGVTHVAQFDDLTKWCHRALEQDLEDTTLVDRYTDAYRKWIMSSQLNTVQGLDQFPYACFANGTTEVFDKFYIKHRDRRIRVLGDEYSYHRRFAGAEVITNWGSLSKGDCLVISCPYVTTGQVHPMMEEILSICDYLEVPVLIDAAYYGLCGGLTINLAHPSIEDVAFSLSKTFGTSKFRVGVRFSKSNEDSLATLNLRENVYVNRFGALLGIELMRDFCPDYLWQTYRSNQLQICQQMQLTPSATVIFGIDTQGLYPGPNPADEGRRLCLSRQLSLPTIL